MDASCSSSSSSMSPPSSKHKHDVFLSFRGEDTRAKFTSHLHAKLIQKNIETYMDHRLSKGDEISPSLIEAIQGSRISVIIFSENFASSSWCLGEVVCILKCKKQHGQIVIPVFYDIDPSHVRKQLESYETAFAKHEERFKERMEKVGEWRAALTQVACIAGWDSRTYGSESEFVEEIVEDILLKLNDMSSADDSKDLIGVNKSIEEVEQLLCINDSSSVRIIGIWGMGGLGKTTLARVLFKLLSSKFQGCCFLENVREESGKDDGLTGLRRKMFSELLEEKDVHTITSFAKERLRRRKALIFLDDVDDPEQLEVLAADHHGFGPGSRIIITTRDAQVLRDRADEKYELKGLTFDDSLKLFYLNAFKRNSPTIHEVMLSKRAVNYANGNPLALKVLGSFLRSREREKWENELNKLIEVPNQRIHNILKVSFDGLDEVEKAIFLDVVSFFFVGQMTCKNFVERRLGAHHSYVDIGIASLIDKSLVTVKDDNLVIHDLLKEMGWEIVRQQCIKEPGKRSRLWNEENVYHVLKNNTGTPTIEGISFYAGTIACGLMFEDNKPNLNPTVFKEMHGLWLLDIFSSFGTYFHLPRDLQYLPGSLKCLLWHFWPWQYLPSTFMPHNLVELRMPYSKLKRLWNGVQHLGNLKHVDLHCSYHLEDISALSQAPNLVSVDLSNCERLSQVPSLGFQTFDKLTSLDQSYHKCDNSECQSLGHLKLDGCKNFEVVGKISGNVKELHLGSTLVQELPSSICSLDNLNCLNLSKCCRLKTLPSDIQKLKSLKRLDLSGCSSFDMLPVLPRNLIELDLSGTSIEQVPSSAIEYLSNLEKLVLFSCRRLKSLPSSISRLKSLKKLDLTYCKNLEIFPVTLEPMVHLETLNLGRSGIRVLPSFASMHFLISLDLRLCNLSDLPKEIGCLSSLEKLCLHRNNIEEIPVAIKNLSKLVELVICDCKRLKSLPELPSSLEFLDARQCISMETISNTRDVLTQRSSINQAITYRQFFYYHCLKLDQKAWNNIVSEFQLRTLCTTIKSALPHGRLKKSNYPGVGICYPGYMIPKWFTYQSQKSSINVKLSSDWLNTNFLGFALCAAVAEKTYDYRLLLDLSCAFHFKTGFVKSPTFCRNFNHYELLSVPREKMFKSSHVFMWYNHESYRDYLDASEVSFHFNSKALKVRACGIRLLYLHDAEEFGIKSDVTCPTIDSDTAEPHLKRIKTFDPR